MVYVYITSLLENDDFIQRLRADFEKAGFDYWYDDGQTRDEEVYAQLQKATHLVVPLSAAAMANERVLAALEFARQNDLKRLALRLGEITDLPPQLRGVLPLDFTSDDVYEDSVETLIEDIRFDEQPPDPELPEELLKMLESPIAVERKIGIEKLVEAVRAEPELKNMAISELNAMMFREREVGLKGLLRATVQTLERGERMEETEPSLPSKDELAEQAGDQAVVIEPPPTESVPQSPAPEPSSATGNVVYLWQSRRWHLLMGSLAIVIGMIAFVIGGHLAYLLPIMLPGLTLPHMNILLRNNGEFVWSMAGSTLVNALLGLVITGLVALIFVVALEELKATCLLINAVMGTGFGALIGWLSSIKFEVGQGLPTLVAEENEEH